MYVPPPVGYLCRKMRQETDHASIRQSVRRAALRSVASAARAAVPKAAPTSQFAKNMVVKQSAVSMARYFSQGVRMMNTSNTESQVTEEPQGEMLSAM